MFLSCLKLFSFNVSVCVFMQMVHAPSAGRGKLGETSKAGVTDSALEQQLAALKDL